MKTTTSSSCRRVGRAAAMGIALLLWAAAPAGALTLEEARSGGLVCEKPDGYLMVVRDTGGVAAFVEAVNAQRRQEYQRLAAANGVPLAAVQQQAGIGILGRVAGGTLVMTSSGQCRPK